MRLRANALMVLALTALPCPAGAVPTCKLVWPVRTTLRDELTGADVVLVGKLANATPANPKDAGEGITDFLVGRSFKLPPGFHVEKTIVLDRYLPDAAKGNKGFLLFFDVSQGKPDMYRGIPLKANTDLLKYVAGILKIKDQKPSKRLRFYFNYLGSKETEIADDALLEFRGADYKDLREGVSGLPDDKLATWLRMPGLRPDRLVDFAFLLGHCSKDRAKHARLLHALTDEAIKRSLSNLDGLLIGYVLLNPKEGLQYTRSILKNPKKDFLTCCAALETLRFFRESRPDVLPRQDILEALALLLPQQDIADMVVEDFRRWKCWEMTPHVLALVHSKAHDVPIVQRALLRFALCSPREEAKLFIAEKRKGDPEAVRDAEDGLKLEQVPAPLPK